jgi:hypothetical protein
MRLTWMARLGLRTGEPLRASRLVSRADQLGFGQQELGHTVASPLESHPEPANKSNNVSRDGIHVILIPLPQGVRF